MAGATGYTLYRAASRSGVYSALATVSGMSYTHTTDLSADTEQYYKVSATDSVDEGALSEVVSAKIAPPAAPAGFAAEPLSASSLKIWNAVPSAALYTLWRSNIQIVTQTATSYTDTGLRENFVFLSSSRDERTR